MSSFGVNSTNSTKQVQFPNLNKSGNVSKLENDSPALLSFSETNKPASAGSTSSPESIAETQAKRADAHQKAIDEISKMKEQAQNNTQTKIEEIVLNDGSKIFIHTKYNSSGVPIEGTAVREDGSISSKTEYKDGKPVRQEQFYRDTGELAMVSEYNENGKVSKEMHFDPDSKDNITSTISYEYYENGNVKSQNVNDWLGKKVSEYYENGILKRMQDDFKCEEYNEDGNLIKCTNSRTHTVETKEYDSQGREIKSQTLDLETNQLIESSTVEYLGNIQRHIVKDMDGETNVLDYINHDDGSMEHRENGIFVSRNKFESYKENGRNIDKSTEYDEKGNITKISVEEFYKENNNDVRINTNYDSQGNIIDRRKNIIDFEPSIIGQEILKDGVQYIMENHKFYKLDGENRIEISSDEYYKLTSSEEEDF